MNSVVGIIPASSANFLTCAVLGVYCGTALGELRV